MTGLQFYGTVVAIHFHQPNGYLQLTDSTLIATALGWPSNTYPYNSSVALFMGGGSLNVVNCDLTRTLTHSLTHSLNQSLTHSLTQSLTHSLTSR